MLIFFAILIGLAVAISVVGVVLERGGAQARMLEGRLRGGNRTATVDRRDAKRDLRYSVIPGSTACCVASTWASRSKSCSTRPACRCASACS
jgi:hypothetical protein